ncbi:MAG: hypothetical protein AAGD35_14195 [Actinomycetota bacterium]
MRRERGDRARFLIITATVAAASLVASGCTAGGGLSAEEGAAAPTTATTAATAETTTTSEAPTTTEAVDDYEAVYRRLHPIAIGYILDPLGPVPDAIDCDANLDCIRHENDALDGLSWRGMEADNLTVTDVALLEEQPPLRAWLMVTVAAIEPIEQVDAEGNVVRSIEVPPGATRRVMLLRDGTDDDWRLVAPADGRSWVRSDEPVERDPFSGSDPLDETRRPIDDGTATGGVAWETSVTVDRACVRAEKPLVGVLERCVTAPSAELIEPGRQLLRMFVAGDPDSGYLSVWFGWRASAGILIFDDGTEQRLGLFRMDTSDVFEVDSIAVGVAFSEQRPAAVSAVNRDDRFDDFSFNWPVRRREASEPEG